MKIEQRSKDRVQGSPSNEDRAEIQGSSPRISVQRRSVKDSRIEDRGPGPEVQGIPIRNERFILLRVKDSRIKTNKDIERAAEGRARTRYHATGGCGSPRAHLFPHRAISRARDIEKEPRGCREGSRQATADRSSIGCAAEPQLFRLSRDRNRIRAQVVSPANRTFGRRYRRAPSVTASSRPPPLRGSFSVPR